MCTAGEYGRPGLGKLSAGYAEAVAALAHPGVTLDSGLTRLKKEKREEEKAEYVLRFFLLFNFLRKYLPVCVCAAVLSAGYAEAVATLAHPGVSLCGREHD